ncbi:DNA-binding domain-containing protein, partial [Ectobacillus panaciterrae]|uniref:DNA-binding domain-containing protein n=1 Tax=Ectobacillus panaciterrae TaxID=363872 RepID=UPI00040F4683
MNRDYIITEIMSVLKQCISSHMPFSQIEQILERAADKCHVEYEDVVALYNKMSLFQAEIEKMGGEEAYEKSGFMWFKPELELLLHAYKFFQKNGISVIIISEKLSKDGLNIFPKTKSQLQNTYYKLRNNQLSLENLTKQKPGRKPGQEYPKESRKQSKQVNWPAGEIANQQNHLAQRDAQVVHDKPKKNLVQLLSGMIHHFQIISEHNKENEKKMYQLIEGIYELSSIAAQSTKTPETEVSLLLQETERLKREKTEMAEHIQSIVGNVHSFIESSDVEQIKGLSKFVDTCKTDLNKLSLYSTQATEV